MGMAQILWAEIGWTWRRQRKGKRKPRGVEQRCLKVFNGLYPGNISMGMAAQLQKAELRGKTEELYCGVEKIMRCDGSVFLQVKELQGIEKKQLVMNSK